jgi:hypothetical protein
VVGCGNAQAEKAKYDKYRRQYDAAMTRYRNAENKLKAGKSLAEVLRPSLFLRLWSVGVYAREGPLVTVDHAFDEPQEEKEVAEAKKELERITDEVTGVLELINKKTEMMLFERVRLFLCACA